MVRKLTIEIWGQNWSIEDMSVDKNSKSYKVVDRVSDGLALLREYKGKIAFAFNYTLPDWLIVEIKDSKECGDMFLEQCLFEYENQTFTGDLIDALLFIQNELKKQLQEGQDG